ncbi:MAG: phosphoribosylamine--glycine ligase [Planctomycetota bacterium]|nr:phosphoribosylamine--glycine ligase [Planctomycetota bacterium]
MKLLLVGSGGREHALAWKLAQSPLCEKLWIAPGNPGTAAFGENVPIAADALPELVRFAVEQKVELCVIGPEVPLVGGLADLLSEHQIPTFGPRAAAAELEGSKAWCKEVLVRHRVPTAAHRTFVHLAHAQSYLDSGARYPCVVKASGLAAGKGVVICMDRHAARDAVRSMLEGRRFGAAGTTVVIEEFLEGPEASAFCITDGRAFAPFESCMDHKTLLDGGQGPNTGGMGAISPNPEISDRTRALIEKHVFLPTVHGLNHEGHRFQGVLFAGLKLTAGGPKVLEYNVRFGDPECQVLMMRLRSDLLPYLYACATNTLDKLEAPEWDPRPACCVVLAARGYPEAPLKGDLIEGLDDLTTSDTLQVFHSGTALRDGKLVSNGGRVLAVTAVGEDAADARNRAYAACAAIRFEGMQFRRDIGLSALRATEPSGMS